VVYNAKEAKLRKLRKWLFGIPILLGTIFSASSIPFIQTGVVGCQISPPMPLATTEVLRELGLPYLYWPFIWFMIVPGYTAIFYSTMITLYMLYRMKKVDQRSKKWVMSQVHESQKRSAKHPITALTIPCCRIYYLVAFFDCDDSIKALNYGSLWSLDPILLFSFNSRFLKLFSIFSTSHCQILEDMEKEKVWKFQTSG
jgi:hypothetical protein